MLDNIYEWTICDWPNHRDNMFYGVPQPVCCHIFPGDAFWCILHPIALTMVTVLQASAETSSELLKRGFVYTESSLYPFLSWPKFGNGRGTPWEPATSAFKQFSKNEVLMKS